MSLRIRIESPTLLPEDSSAYGEHYAFVFDGLGGTGGRRRTNAAGETLPEAKIASGAAASAMDNLMRERWSAWSSALDFTDQSRLETQVDQIVNREIRQAMETALRKAAAAWDAEEGKLPTTIAGWLTFPAPEGKTFAVAVWAGDSRCYTIDSKKMKLYTRDDSREGYQRDAMQDCTIQDSLPMDNRLGIDKKFVLHYNCHLFDGPILLISCSDGFYNCRVESPMHLEYFFRCISDQGSMEEMAANWKDFILSSGRLDDDTATLESIFIHSDPEDVDALREMLAAPLDELEEKYIKSFPQQDSSKTFSDIDTMIGRFAKNLCSPRDEYGFVRSLRENAARMAENEEIQIPADLPCAAVVRKMRTAFQQKTGKIREERGKLETDRKQKEEALLAFIRNVKKIQWTYQMEPAPLSPATERLLSAKIPEGFWGKGKEKERAKRDAYGYFRRSSFVAGLYSKYLIENTERLTSWFDLMDNVPPQLDGVPFPRSKREAFLRARQLLVDSMALLNRQAELEGFDAETEGALPGTVDVLRQEVRLSDDEATCLRQTIFRALDGKFTPDSLLDEIELKAADIVWLEKNLAEVKAAREKLAEFDRTEDVSPEVPMEDFDEYLGYHRTADAKAFIETWLESGERPSWFLFPEELEERLQKNMAALLQRKKDNEDMIRDSRELTDRRYRFWLPYKAEFEAFDTPFVLPFAAGASPEENRAEGQPSEPGNGGQAEASAKDVPPEETGNNSRKEPAGTEAPVKMPEKGSRTEEEPEKASAAETENVSRRETLPEEVPAVEPENDSQAEEVPVVETENSSEVEAPSEEAAAAETESDKESVTPVEEGPMEEPAENPADSRVPDEQD